MFGVRSEPDKDADKIFAAARKQYAEGEAKLNAITPIYNAILPLYNDYQRLQAEYDAAVA